MKGVKQKIFSNKRGDCFRACLASILEIENSDKFVKIRTDDWLINYLNFFGEIGLRLNWDSKKIWREGYWIATVPSKNFKKTRHAIVMLGDRVAFDPSTHKQYRKGRNLLGKDIVSFGYWLEVSDFTKLKEYLK